MAFENDFTVFFFTSFSFRIDWANSTVVSLHKRCLELNKNRVTSNQNKGKSRYKRDSRTARKEATGVRQAKAARSSESRQKSMRPALSPEARENQLISIAVDVAEQQLRNGTASSQVITHFLKLGSMKETLEREKLRQENELLRAKTESLQSAKRVEELYANALNAMRSYSGQDIGGDEDY